MKPSEALTAHREAIRKLVDPLPGATLFDLGGLQVELQDLHALAADVLQMALHRMPRRVTATRSTVQNCPEYHLKALEQNGFRTIRINGSHHILSNGQRKVTVPVHGSADVKIGTLKGIEKQAGVKLK